MRLAVQGAPAVPPIGILVEVPIVPALVRSDAKCAWNSALKKYPSRGRLLNDQRKTSPSALRRSGPCRSADSLRLPPDTGSSQASAMASMTKNGSPRS